MTIAFSVKRIMRTVVSGFLLFVGQNLPNAVEIHLNILSAFSVDLFGLMNSHLVDKLVEYLRRKFADMRVLPYQADKPCHICFLGFKGSQFLLSRFECGCLLLLLCYVFCREFCEHFGGDFTHNLVLIELCDYAVDLVKSALCRVYRLF